MKCPHCETHIDEHEANRCLDAWILEIVFGKPTWTMTKEMAEKHGITYCLPYSTDLNAAWEIIEILRQKYILLPLWSLAVLEGSFPLAICRAAIKATIND